MKIKILIALSMITNLSFAGQFNDAHVDTIATDEDGFVLVTLIGGTEVTPKPSCTSSQDGREFAYDLRSPSGLAWHSMVLSAQATQKKVHFIGTENCLNFRHVPDDPHFEEIGIIYILK